MLICPSKTVGNSHLMSKVRTGWLAMVAARCRLVAGDELGECSGRMVNPLAAFQDTRVPKVLG